jgi:hypothetical protein
MPLYRAIAHGTSTWGTWSHGHTLFRSVADPAAVAAAFRTAIGVLWSNGTGDLQLRSWYPTGTGVRQVEVYQIDAQRTKTQISTRLDVTGAVGTSTSPTLPPSTSVCLTWRSSVPGKAGRGRTYLPPPATTVMGADGRIGPDNAVGALILGARAFAQSLRSQGLGFGAQPRGVSGVFNWTVVELSDWFATQRPRIEGTDNARDVAVIS